MEHGRVFRRLTQQQVKERSGSEQNYLIATGYTRINDVLMSLIKQKLTVLSITIDTDRPRIQLLECPTPEQLRSQVENMRSDDDGRRWVEHRATVNECVIFWRVPLVH